jgi:hypothetical protein
MLFEGERIALIAAALYAIEPFSILFTSLLASETLFTGVVMVGVYTRVYIHDHPEQKTWSVARRINYLNRAAEHILVDSSLTYAWIYFDGILRGTFDPGFTEFLRFFDLYPKESGLLTVEVDKGRIATIEALYANPLLFWNTAYDAPGAADIPVLCVHHTLRLGDAGLFDPHCIINNGLLYGYCGRTR